MFKKLDSDKFRQESIMSNVSSNISLINQETGGPRGGFSISYGRGHTYCGSSRGERRNLTGARPTFQLCGKCGQSVT